MNEIQPLKSGVVQIATSGFLLADVGDTEARNFLPAMNISRYYS
jgi:hypothetical protein